MDKKIDVMLISMPFGPMATPSIGLSLLKAGLDKVGIRSTILYFNLKFAGLIGEDLYYRINEETLNSALIGEWIFSQSLFGSKTKADITRFTDQIMRRRGLNPWREDSFIEPAPEDLIAEVTGAVTKVKGFLKDCLNTVVEHQPRVVGFTSVFQQQIASLSLAKLIKKQLPATQIIFGGGNCEGVMGREMLRQFHFLDVVVSGEGDLVFPGIVQCILGNLPIRQSVGVYSRDRASIDMCIQQPTNTPVIEDLNTLQIPDYDDYFRQLKQSPLRKSITPSIPFETSRGCWWGAKHHCTFCGLNGSTMAYRSKTAQRALDELITLNRKYPGHHVNVVDNILDMKYFNDFIPGLTALKLGLRLSYEIKANLTKDQLELLGRAGIKSVQPGIESLSNTVLGIMRKGVRATQNIQLLKWCQEFDILPVWNLLWGFPGEPPEEYEKMAALIPLLTHLRPPSGFSKIRTDRFSPNFDSAHKLGFKDLRPYPAYYHIYALPDDSINNLAFHFTYEYAEPQECVNYIRPVFEQVRIWVESHQRSTLFWVEKGNRLIIWDTRPIAERSVTVLAGLAKLCYQGCDKASGLQTIVKTLEGKLKRKIDIEKVRDNLDDLTERKLVLKEGGEYLALAIPKSLNLRISNNTEANVVSL